MANLSHRYVEGTDWDYSEFAIYDLGQAVAHMTVQARALGMHVRQFRAFDRDGTAAAFAVSAQWEVTTLSAVGQGPAAKPTTDAIVTSTEQRRRRPLEDLLWAAT